jgi:hypothetical protein
VVATGRNYLHGSNRAYSYFHIVMQHGRFTSMTALQERNTSGSIKSKRELLTSLLVRCLRTPLSLPALTRPGLPQTTTVIKSNIYEAAACHKQRTLHFFCIGYLTDCKLE